MVSDKLENEQMSTKQMLLNRKQRGGQPQDILFPWVVHNIFHGAHYITVITFLSHAVRIIHL